MKLDSIVGKAGKKASLALLAGMLSLPAAKAAQSRTLAWDPSPGYYETNDASMKVTDYFVHVGPGPRTYTNSYPTPASNTTYTVTGLVEGATYFFTVTAANRDGLQSGYCNEVFCTIPVIYVKPAPSKPRGFEVIFPESAAVLKPSEGSPVMSVSPSTYTSSTSNPQRRRFVSRPSIDVPPLWQREGNST